MISLARTNGILFIKKQIKTSLLNSQKEILRNSIPNLINDIYSDFVATKF